MRQADILHDLLVQYFPGKKIVCEYGLSKGLRIDFYLPELNLGIEYDGIQHDKFVPFFHKDKSEFYMAQNRDEQKIFACEQLGIILLRFSHRDKLTLDLLDNRYFGPGSGKVKNDEYLSRKVKAKLAQKLARKIRYDEYKESDVHQERLKKAREFAKERRRQLKVDK